MASKVKPDYVLKPLPDDGTRGYRVELDEFMADNDVVNIFLIALHEMQQKSLVPVDGKMNLLKYYALGAIHGSPNEDWNNYPNTPTENGIDDDGYCHHGLDTFPTWHRPYMMLYERAIYEEMLKQAGNYKDASYKARYHAAAQKFRLPYFDPVMPRHHRKPDSKRIEEIWGLPEILRRKQVWVRKPGDPQKLVPMENPLYSFEFPKAANYKENGRDSPDFPPKTSSARTVRAPNDDGEQNDDELELKFQNQASNYATTLWQLLSPSFVDSDGKEINAAVSWSQFANHDTTPRKGKTKNNEKQESKIPFSYTTSSIESWHDLIHGLIGQGSKNRQHVGHMSYISLAGFDPMFWMHHNNIDRILSLRQAMYGKDVVGHSGHEMDDGPAELPLKPFAKDMDGTCWKSSDSLIADYWSPGFAVPGSKRSDPKNIKETVQNYITRTYLWATNKNLGSKETADKEKGDTDIFKNWPMKLDHSEALYGTAATKKEAEAEKPQAEVVSMIAVDPRTSNLVHREMRVTDEKRVFNDQPIELKSTLRQAFEVIDAVPANAYWTSEQEQAAMTESWNAHIRVRKFAFDGSFSVHVFIGHVKDDQTERYFTKKNEVGFSSIFAADAQYAESCSSCKRNRGNDMMHESVVPLTTQLIDYLKDNPKSADLIRDGQYKTIDSLEPVHVVPFLKEQLQWRMIRADGELLSGQEQMAQLEVTITSRDYKAPTQEHIMGVYGLPLLHTDCTSNKAGGYGYVYP